MRLAQAARRIGITQNEIIDILNEHGHDIKKHGNVKLNNDQFNLLTKKYAVLAPDDAQLPEGEPAAEQEEDNLSGQPSHDDGPSTGGHNLEDNQTAEEQANIKQPHEKAKTEVIRAKKIKLEGIKVIGKIELPEKKAKEEDNTKKENKPRDRNGKKQQRKTISKKRETFAEKQARQERKALKKKQQRERYLKEQKKKHYFENVQPTVIQKSGRKKKRKAIALKTKAVQAKKTGTPKYKNPIRRLWAWLNGAYDN